MPKGSTDAAWEAPPSRRPSVAAHIWHRSTDGSMHSDPEPRPRKHTNPGFSGGPETNSKAEAAHAINPVGDTAAARCKAFTVLSAERVCARLPRWTSLCTKTHPSDSGPSAGRCQRRNKSCVRPATEYVESSERAVSPLSPSSSSLGFVLNHRRVLPAPRPSIDPVQMGCRRPNSAGIGGRRTTST